MRYLYIDCDGVIFNTIHLAFLEMERLGIDTKDDDAIFNYFKTVDWNYLMDNGGIINDSIDKIKILIEANCFSSVSIATHRCSYTEGIIKTDKFNKLIPDVKIITIPKKIGKHYAVPAKDNFLIDDDVNKVKDWINAGGIGILFNSKDCLYGFKH